MALLAFLLLAVLSSSENAAGVGVARTLRDPLRPFRLAGDILPRNYTIRIVTHFDDDSFRFYGQVLVDVDVVQDTREIRLHATELQVDQRSVSLTPLDQPEDDSNSIPEVVRSRRRRRRRRRQVQQARAPMSSGHYHHSANDVNFRGLSLSNVTMESALEQLVITLEEPVKAGTRYRLGLRYWGTLSHVDRGYYRGAYTHNNQTRFVSSTVFEPADARRAFPCFDEPYMKANFSLILGRHMNYTSSANMPLAYTEPMKDTPGWFWDFYPATPKMSTYLVAFMVHGLEGRRSSDAPEAGGRPVSVWTTPGRGHLSNFSLWMAPQALTTLAATVGAPPVLPKQDLVAVPGFQSEALENWGLVSFEEHHLLVPPNASQLGKQSVSTVVAHELAHIWFGNLITPSWWSDIWLSEGFATYFAAVAVERIIPSWRFQETAVGNAFILVTTADASPNSLPLIHPASNPGRLRDVFNVISYDKGYWMLRMLNRTLGPDVFDAGIRRYVQKHMYGSVQTADLWAALQEAVDEQASLGELKAVSSEQVDVLVVKDDDKEEGEEPSVVVPSSTTTTTSAATPTTTATSVAPPMTSTTPSSAATPKTPSPSTATTPESSSKAFSSDAAAFGAKQRRDVSQQVDKSPLITQLVLGGPVADVVELDEEQPSDLPGTEQHKSIPAYATNVTEPAERPEVPANIAAINVTKDVVEETKATEEVQSPPRRGPGPSVFTVDKDSLLPRPLEQVMKNWVQLPGYPLISVYRNLETGTVTLNQRRYLSSGGVCNATSATWWIPVHFSTTRTAKNHPAIFWMPPSCANVTLPVKVPRDEWVLLNAGLSGLYRVRYDARTLQQLSRLPRADWLRVSALTRLQLVSDALELARQSRAPYQHALQMANHLGRDPSPLVWRAALPHLMWIERQLRGRRDGVALRSWLQELVSPHAQLVGFVTRAQDSPHQASLRQRVTVLACRADHSSCQRKAKKALKQLMAGNNEAVAAGPLTGVLLCAAVRWSGPAEWRFLRKHLQQHPAGPGPQRRAVASALGCSRDQETLRSLLAETVAVNSTLHRADVPGVLASVAEGEGGADLALRFVEEQAAQLHRRLGDPLQVKRAIRDIAGSLNSKRQLERLENVLHQFRSLTPSRSPPSWGRDLVQENIRWAERSRNEVGRWLRARQDAVLDIDLDDELELRGVGSVAKRVAKATSSKISRAS